MKRGTMSANADPYGLGGLLEPPRLSSGDPAARGDDPR